MERIVPESSPERERPRIIERPDGFYWQSRETGAEYGPFVTLLEAERDAEAGAQDDAGDTETLAEAEAEIGMADWIDPETGAPAEEEIPRLEDH